MEEEVKGEQDEETCAISVNDHDESFYLFLGSICCVLTIKERIILKRIKQCHFLSQFEIKSDTGETNH